MAKVTKTKEEVRQQNVAEAVSKTEAFFKEYGKILYGIVIGILLIALAILAYNRFILQPKKQQALEQMVKAEQWFEGGEYELALNGDDNYPGLLNVIDQYGSKAPKAANMYAGVALLRTGEYEQALKYLKQYKGTDPIMMARCLSCIGDCYVELQDYTTAVDWFTKAAKTTDNAFAAAYLLKAGIAAEAAGDNAKALSFYEQIKDQWASAPEAMESDKYISRIQTAK